MKKTKREYVGVSGGIAQLISPLLKELDGLSIKYVNGGIETKWNNCHISKPKEIIILGLITQSLAFFNDIQGRIIEENDTQYLRIIKEYLELYKIELSLINDRRKNKHGK